MTTRSRSLTCLLCAGLLLLIPQVAVAGANAGGTLILHANESLVYTNDMESPCGLSGLDSCSAAVTSVPWESEHTVVFHVLAAFPPESQPRMKGVSFGIDHDPEKFHLVAHHTCADFEVPDDGWPGPGIGVGESWNDPQTDRLRDVYWFAGYAYSEANPDSTSFALIPRSADGGIFVDDAAPRMADSVAAYGRLGFGMNGYSACPDPPRATASPNKSSSLQSLTGQHSLPRSAPRSCACRKTCLPSPCGTFGPYLIRPPAQRFFLLCNRQV